MKHNQDIRSDTDRLIEQAFEQDRERLPQPPSTPSVRLLQKFSSPTAPVPHTMGIFASIGTKWLIAIAAVSLTAVIGYFSFRANPTVSVRDNPPVHRTPESTGSDTLVESIPNGFSAVPTRTPATHVESASHVESANVNTAKTKVASSAIEDSLLREQISHPIVIPAPDSAQTTIHTRSHQ